MLYSCRISFRCVSRILTLAVLLLACANRPVQAQSQDGQSRTQRALRAFAGFFSVGGYFYTDSSARSALGNTKFSGDTQIFVRPKYYGRLRLSGGLEIVSANDHFFPFSSSGNDFSLIGPAFRVSTRRVLGVPQPFFTGGLFAGRIRSERQGFDRTDFTPSASFGVEYPFARYFTLTAAYRVSERINGVNTDGFSIGLRFF